MAQYLVFLALAPIALLGSLSALFLPRIVHSYHRFVWLRVFNYLQLVFLLINLAELLTRNRALKQSLAAIDYLFIGSGPSIWLLFSLEYSGLVRKFRPWQALLFIIPVAACVAGLANGPQGLVWRDLRFVDVSWILAMRTGGYGPMAVIMFISAYSLLLAGAWILALHAARSHRLYRHQTAWMLAGVILPLVFNAAFVLKMIPGWHKDYSALAECFGGFCFSIGCLRYRLFSVVPVPQRMIREQMRVGMVITDADGVIVDLNPAACRMIDKSETLLLGSPSGPIMSRIEKLYEVTRHPINRADGQLEAWHLELRSRDSAPALDAAGPYRGNFLQDPQDSPILSLGELRVVEMLAQNLANKEIADRLGLSANTVRFHLSNVYRKTGASNRAELLHRISDSVSNKFA
jgi:DNA-binding CsgD family transcriptional regulator